MYLVVLQIESYPDVELVCNLGKIRQCAVVLLVRWGCIVHQNEPLQDTTLQKRLICDRINHGETDQTGITGISQPFLGQIGPNFRDIKYM